MQREKSISVVSVEKPTGRRPISVTIRKVTPKRSTIEDKLVGEPSPGSQLTAVTRKSTKTRKHMNVMHMASPSNRTQP